MKFYLTLLVNTFRTRFVEANFQWIITTFHDRLVRTLVKAIQEQWEEAAVTEQLDWSPAAVLKRLAPNYPGHNGLIWHDELEAKLHKIKEAVANA